jgi:Uma2 family endonuclease
LALLLVEVADTTLVYDREQKGSLYARAGVPDYWVMNLPEERLEVFRDPIPSPGSPYGWAYRTVLHLRAGDFISPQAIPQTSVAVIDLLP